MPPSADSLSLRPRRYVLGAKWLRTLKWLPSPTLASRDEMRPRVKRRALHIEQHLASELPPTANSTSHRELYGVSHSTPARGAHTGMRSPRGLLLWRSRHATPRNCQLQESESKRSGDGWAQGAGRVTLALLGIRPIMPAGRATPVERAVQTAAAISACRKRGITRPLKNACVSGSLNFVFAGDSAKISRMSRLIVVLGQESAWPDSTTDRQGYQKSSDEWENR